jgi:hypothetical protein
VEEAMERLLFLSKIEQGLLEANTGKTLSHERTAAPRAVTDIRWADQAAQNLEDIKNFISQDSPAYALAVVSKLFNAVSQLEQFPDSGRTASSTDGGVTP